MSNLKKNVNSKSSTPIIHYTLNRRPCAPIKRASHFAGKMCAPTGNDISCTHSVAQSPYQTALKTITDTGSGVAKCTTQTETSPHDTHNISVSVAQPVSSLHAPYDTHNISLSVFQPVSSLHAPHDTQHISISSSASQFTARTAWHAKISVSQPVSSLHAPYDLSVSMSHIFDIILVCIFWYWNCVCHTCGMLFVCTFCFWSFVSHVSCMILVLYILIL